MNEPRVLLARAGAGVARRDDLCTISVQGPDRVRFLNGMVTNDVAALSSGQGLLAVKTSAKGRVEAWVRIRAEDGALLVDVREPVAERLAGALVKHLIMDDCTLLDATPNREVLAVVGPKASELLGQSGVLGDLSAIPRHGWIKLGETTVIADAGLGLAGYELHVPKGQRELWLERLTAHGAVMLEPEDLEVLRVEAGRPVEGKELTDEVLPMEAKLTSAISTTKGCYVGQEVIARGTNLGGVRWGLVSLRLAGPVAPGATLVSAGAGGVGQVTSAVWSDWQKTWIGLGYVRREHEAPGTVLATSEGVSVEVVVPPSPS